MNWTIQRLELVAFHPVQNRWQFFHERQTVPSDEGSVYRKQIQEMLATLRQVLHAHSEAKSNGRSINVTCPAEPAPHDGEVTINLNNLRAKLAQLNVDPFPMVGRVREYLRAENLDPPDRVKIEGLLSQISQTKDPTELCLLPRDQALELLSVLPCARHWDFGGYLSFSKGRDEQFGNEESLVFDIRGENRQWSHGFPSILTFPTDRLENDGEDSLGRAVRVHVNKECKSFFEFVNVLSSKIIDRPRDDLKQEKAWYAFYGQLADAIQEGLANSQTTAGKNERPPVFLFTFPMRVCGYDHYLNVYLEPNSTVYAFGNALEELEVLGFSQRDRTIFNESVRELLVQIHIAAFQASVTNELEQRCHWSDEELLRLFARYAPHLVRLAWIRKEKHPKWAYGYEKPLLEPWHEIHSFSDCTEPTASDHSYQFGPKVYGGRKATIDPGSGLEAWVPWEKAYDGKLTPLFSGTSKQRLWEQLLWLKERARKRDEALAVAHNLERFVRKV